MMQFSFQPTWRLYRSWHVKLSALAAVCFLALFLSGCGTYTNQDNVASQLSAQTTASTTWEKQFDFDADGIMDMVNWTFSGGAHCCYQVGVRLSSNSLDTSFPFEFDGGYIEGLDLSQPDQFIITNTGPDGRAEMRMHIASYNGKEYPLPDSWTEKYHISSHNVRIYFFKGKWKAEDVSSTKR